MGKSRKIDERLRAVWNHGALIGGPQPATPWRYVPQSYNGGAGWGVFDRKDSRFVDTKLMQIPLPSLRDELLTSVLN